MDTDLVIRASSGDHDAFAEIATSIASRFHGTAYAILRESTLAEDAAQSASDGRSNTTSTLSA
ncbi:MAG: hypothetical protein PVG27_02130 [Chloroflexota bacterium]